MSNTDKLREIAKLELDKRIVGILMAHGVNSIDAFNSTPDLTALLEQHKEMMLREELIKFGDYFNECVSKTIYTSLIDEYLKNVKK